jgi:hypothetical protein
LAYFFGSANIHLSELIIPVSPDVFQVFFFPGRRIKVVEIIDNRQLRSRLHEFNGQVGAYETSASG